MPRLGPISRRDLISNLRKLGFAGPKAGGKHDYMIQDQLSVTIPNPHGSDISRDFLRRILRQARITEKEWEAL